MNYIWGSMILIGILYGTLTGQVDAVSDALLSSAGEAVTLCITMLGVVSLWSGIMEIANASGLIRAASQKIRPLIRFLFPGIPQGHEAEAHITTNFIANFLGLGWAATPAGLKAMESLAELDKMRREQPKMQESKRADALKGAADRKGRKRVVPPDVASNEMCTFLILNISSLQLIPVNVIAYRTQYGSVNPTAIVGPGIVATAVSTVVAVGFCKVMDRKK
jgi:spore maturation protein A